MAVEQSALQAAFEAGAGFSPGGLSLLIRLLLYAGICAWGAWAVVGHYFFRAAGRGDDLQLLWGVGTVLVLVLIVSLYLS